MIYHLLTTDLAQIHCNNVRTILGHLLWISSLYHINYKKLLWSCYDKLEQEYGGWLILYTFNCMGESIWVQRHVNGICD